jgi:tRNA (guanine37-N1)-methyltransferase
MVMKAEPFFRAKDALFPRLGEADAVVLLSPRGRRFDHATAERFARLDRLVLLCGRYEGIDERVREGVATEELSLGDFVLTGGEVAALAVIEAAVRLIPGALGDEQSAGEDSFAAGLLDTPHYTRPAVVRGREVPEVLTSGDHDRVRRWRREQALRSTRERRPDLLAAASLTAEDERLLRRIADEAGASPERSPELETAVNQR